MTIHTPSPPLSSIKAEILGLIERSENGDTNATGRLEQLKVQYPEFWEDPIFNDMLIVETPRPDTRPNTADE